MGEVINEIMGEERPWHFMAGFLLDDQYNGDYLTKLSLGVIKNSDQRLFKAIRQLLPDHPEEFTTLSGSERHVVLNILGHMAEWWEDEVSRLAFLRGYAAKNMHFDIDFRGDHKLLIQLRGSEPCAELGMMCKQTYGFECSNADGRRLELYGVNAITLAGQLFEHNGMVAQKDQEAFYQVCQKDVGSHTDERFTKAHQFIKHHKDAVAPSKGDASDSGYDIVLLEKVKEIGAVSLYDTAISVVPAPGYYFDLVPRSSIIKSGYILANSVGIIDRSYRGKVMVALIKIDPDAEDLPLPNRLAQLVPRKIEHHAFLQTSEAAQTARGAGGFGSTGNV